MEAQLHHTHGRHYDDPLHPAVIKGADIHDEEEHGVVKKVKAKVEKLKATVKHGHGHGHHDEQHHKDHAQAVNDTPAVRSGLVEPADMGYPVLVEDLHTTHSDILDPPVRSFAQWEEEERQGVPPPLSTGIYGTDLSHVGHHGSGQDVNREHDLRGGIGKSTGMVEDSSYTTHSDIVNPPVRSFAQWEEERQDSPPPLSTGIYGTDLSQVGHHGSRDQDVNREQLRGGIGKSTGMVEDPSAPNSTTAVSPANYQTKVTDPTKTGGNEAGITEVLRSFDKMGVYDEPFTKSSETDKNEPKVYTGSHDQFAPEPVVENLRSFDKMGVYDEPFTKSSETDKNEPKVYTGSHDQFAPDPVVENTPSNTVAGDPSSHSSSYTEKITSATSAIGNKAAAAKDMIASKLGSSGENKSESPKANPKSSFHSTYAHKVADSMTGTLGPVYEKVVGAGSSAMSKIQGDKSESPKSKGVSVKEYLADSFRPGDEDKAMSETITHALHRGEGNQETTSTTTTIYVRDEGERRLQESGN